MYRIYNIWNKRSANLWIFNFFKFLALFDMNVSSSIKILKSKNWETWWLLFHFAFMFFQLLIIPIQIIYCFKSYLATPKNILVRNFAKKNSTRISLMTDYRKTAALRASRSTKAKAKGNFVGENITDAERCREDVYLDLCARNRSTTLYFRSSCFNRKLCHAFCITSSTRRQSIKSKQDRFYASDWPIVASSD